MDANTTASTEPITPARFAAAIKDLDLPTLRLKVLEIRNSIAHLLYSNAELKPFAQGTDGTPPDQDCADAIKENEEVLERMAERIALAKAEVEERGASWALFEEDRKKLFEESGEKKAFEAPRMNGTGPDGPAGVAGRAHPAWSDGTIQVGTIRQGGEGVGSVGGLTDEELARRLQERMRALEEEDDDEEGGMHL